MEGEEIVELTEEACVDMLSPETYWLQVNGHMVNCKSDLDPTETENVGGFPKL